MEGQCYALIWGIMHFCQFLYRNHFTLRTDHKLLKWLAIIFDAYGQRGRWIDMLQDFNFKILNRSRFKHLNADVLSRNPVNKAKEDEYFSQEIQDIRLLREMGIWTWIGRRSIQSTTTFTLFMVETNEMAVTKGANEHET
jgi:hypothetical protein